MITLNPKYSILWYYEVIQKWLHYFFLCFLGNRGRCISPGGVADRQPGAVASATVTAAGN